MQKLKLLCVLYSVLFLMPNFTSGQRVEVYLYHDKGFGKYIDNRTTGNDPREIPYLDKLNDVISSLKVRKGMKLEVYKDKGLKGDKAVFFQGDYPRLGCGWNDEISSMRLTKIKQEDFPVVKFYVDDNIGASDAIWQGLSIGFWSVKGSNDGLICNDGITKIVIPEGVQVTVYNDAEKGSTSKTFTKNSENRGVIDLDRWDWNDKISAVEILPQSYALKSLEVGKGKPLEKSPAEKIGFSSTTKNETSSPFVKPVSVKGEFQESYTTEWSNTTTVGLSITRSASVSVGVKGLGEVSGEQSITASIQNAFTIGKSNTKSFTATITDGLNPVVPIGGHVEVDLFAVPVVMEFPVIATYVMVDKNGKEIDGAKPITVNSKITAKKSLKTYSVAREIGGTSTSSNSENYLQVSAVDKGIAWGVSKGDKIYRAQNNNWEEISSSLTLSEVSAADYNTAWGVNSNDDIYRTNNGGSSWTKTGGKLTTISAVSYNIAWGINEKDAIYRTNNGATKWNKTSGLLRLISAVDYNTAWGINGAGVIYRTNNGGSKWNKTSGTLKTVSAVNWNIAWGVNKDGNVYRTNNGAAKWNKTSGTMESVSAVDYNTAWGLDADGNRYITTNGGQTWEKK